MGKRRKASGTCVYCGEVGAVTDDHVPPENLFPKGTPNLPKVPACVRCNGGASDDDEHFRAALALRAEVCDNPAVVELLDATLRGIQRTRTRGNTGSIVSSMNWQPLFSPSGLYLGMGAAYQPDHARMSRVVARIVRGLYFRKCGCRLPDSHGVAVNFAANLDSSVTLLERVSRLSKFAASGKVEVVHPHVFCYAARALPNDPATTVWTMLFFQRTAALCFTLDRNDYRSDSHPLL